MISTYTATVSLDALATIPLSTMARAAQAPAHEPTIWDAKAKAEAVVLAQLEADSIPADRAQIISITKRIGSREDTAEAYALLKPTAPATFTGGPLDGQENPAPPIGIIPGGALPRTARMEPGGFYELAEIDWQANCYRFAWHEEASQIEWL